MPPRFPAVRLNESRGKCVIGSRGRLISGDRGWRIFRDGGSVADRGAFMPEGKAERQSEQSRKEEINGFHYVFHRFSPRLSKI